MVDLMKPEDLKKMSDSAETAKVQENIRQAKKHEEEEKGLHEAFLHRDVPPDVGERVNAAVRRVAELGNHEFQVITFPASYCNDGGRRINNNEQDWPDSLEGYAKRAYAYYEKELRPLGYKLRVSILDYPGGRPGNVGMFLRW